MDLTWLEGIFQENADLAPPNSGKVAVPFVTSQISDSKKLTARLVTLATDRQATNGNIIFLKNGVDQYQDKFSTLSLSCAPTTGGH